MRDVGVFADGDSGFEASRPELPAGYSLRDQCEAAGVAFFAKQDSGPRNETPLPDDLRIRQFPKAGTS